MIESTLPVNYRERLWPSWWLWLVVGAFAGSIGIAYAAPFTPIAGWIAGLLSGGLFAAGLIVSSPVIEVGAGELRAGRAHIAVQHLEPAEELDAAAASRVRGRDADPRAWMLLRGWVPTAVRIAIDDPADPTPYWYLSTRHPSELASAIEYERLT